MRNNSHTYQLIWIVFVAGVVVLMIWVGKRRSRRRACIYIGRSWCWWITRTTDATDCVLIHHWIACCCSDSSSSSSSSIRMTGNTSLKWSRKWNLKSQKERIKKTQIILILDNRTMSSYQITSPSGFHLFVISYCCYYDYDIAMIVAVVVRFIFAILKFSNRKPTSMAILAKPLDFQPSLSVAHSHSHS